MLERHRTALFASKRLAVSIACAGCSASPLPQPMLAIHAPEGCPEIDDPFFPQSFAEAARDAASQVDRHPVQLAYRILSAMKEPSLWCGSAPDSYRFTWMHRDSIRQPTAVRICRNGGGWTATAVRLTNGVNLAVAERNVKRLTEQEADRVLAAFERFGLWRRREAALFGYDVEYSNRDWAQWVVEGRRGSGYRAVVRDVFDDEALRELAGTVFSLIGMEPGQHRSHLARADYGGLASLAGQTGWILLGLVSEDLTRWAAGFSDDYEIVGRPVDRHKPIFPKVREQIRLRLSARVMIRNFAETGEE
jgi:hypothetical protein